MQTFRNNDFLPARNRILLIFSYTLIIVAMMILANASLFNDKIEINRTVLIFPGVITIAALLMQAFVYYKKTPLQLGLIFALILLFYGQSFFSVEASMVGVIRYYFFFNLLILLPLFLTPKRVLLVYLLFILLQITRSIAIELHWVVVPISGWNSLNYVNTYTVLTIFAYFMISTMRKEFSRLISGLQENKTHKQAQVHQLNSLKKRLQIKYENEKQIFETHYNKIERLIQQAEALHHSEAKGGLTPDLMKWHEIADAMDEEILSVDKLTDDDE